MRQAISCSTRVLPSGSLKEAYLTPPPAESSTALTSTPRPASSCRAWSRQQLREVECRKVLGAEGGDLTYHAVAHAQDVDLERLKGRLAGSAEIAGGGRLAVGPGWQQPPFRRPSPSARPGRRSRRVPRRGRGPAASSPYVLGDERQGELHVAGLMGLDVAVEQGRLGRGDIRCGRRLPVSFAEVLAQRRPRPLERAVDKCVIPSSSTTVGVSRDTGPPLSSAKKGLPVPNSTGTKSTAMASSSPRFRHSPPAASSMRPSSDIDMLAIDPFRPVGHRGRPR